MRQDGDIGSMDYDQAVKNGDIFYYFIDESRHFRS